MRKICVVTGTRSEYGLLYWIIKEIESRPELSLQLVVTGMHLSPEFGLTIQNIEKDGFKIRGKVEMLLSSDTAVGISKSMGLGMISFADVLAECKPDIMLVVGDRFEIFSAVSTAMIARIPVAHCHGGEITEGAIDESIRHAITKMSHLHFVSCNEYRNRVIQMGEQPEMVYNVGGLGLENINKIVLLDKQTFEESIQFILGDLAAMVTFHPVTLDNESAEYQFGELLYSFSQFPRLRLIFTKANADADGRIINKMIDNFVQNNSERACAFVSLGQLRYLSALKHVNVVIGNSSSGLLEAPSFGIPTVNIGDRQKGRIIAASVIQCDNQREQIISGIRKATDDSFRAFCKSVKNPYDNGNASEKIITVLKTIELESLSRKKFNNLAF
jgi:GDP/UDP-N,N'-diacetylbacillosamine 2-epimerase (hydrolysing)